MSLRNASERVLPGAERSVPNRRVGRYTFYGQIATGGMATVYFGRLSGQVGFSKTVAIKRPHPHLLGVPEFVDMFVDEARLAARIQHPNVVATLDVVATDDELFLVMDYVHGDSFSHLLTAAATKGVLVPPAIVGSIMVNVLHGLHAAHEAVDEQGHALGIVHRDVSPQNVIVGADGVARVLDFGVAKAVGRLQSTSEGQLKGKLAYMAPEQIMGVPIDARTDVYAASALMWGALAGRRLIDGSNEAELLNRVLHGTHLPPSTHAPDLSPELDAIVMRGLSKDPEERFPTARDMAIAIESAVGLVSPYQVGEWVKSLAKDALALRANRIREMESASEMAISIRDGEVAEVVHRTARHAQSSGVGFDGSAQHGSRTPPPYSATPSPDSDVGPGGVPHPPERSLATLIGIAALVFIVTFGGGLSWLYVTLKERAATAPDPTPVVPVVPAVETPREPTPTATVLQAPPPPAVVELDDPRPPPEQTRPPVAKAVAKESSVPAPVHPTPTASAKTEKPAAAGKPKTSQTVDCESAPFFVDGKGIKRVRPECS